MRLIDADEYAAKMREVQNGIAEWRDEQRNEHGEQFYRADGGLAALIEAKLTLDKMREFLLVSCRDCKHFHAWIGSDGWIGCCGLIDHKTDPRDDWMDRYNDDFCSRGEKR